MDVRTDYEKGTFSMMMRAWSDPEDNLGLSSPPGSESESGCIEGKRDCEMRRPPTSIHPRDACNHLKITRYSTRLPKIKIK